MLEDLIGNNIQLKTPDQMDKIDEKQPEPVTFEAQDQLSEESFVSRNLTISASNLEA